VLTQTPACRPQPQDAYNHFARLSADQQLAVVLAFPGKVDETRLSLAVAAVLRDQPVLGCRFTYADGVARFMPTVRATALSTSSVEDPVATALDAAAEPIDYAGEGVFRADLFRGAEADVLVLRIDHVAADGQGAKQVAELLATAYSRQARRLDERPAPAPDRSARRLLHQFPLARKVSLLTSREAIRPAWGLPVAGEHPGKRHHGIATVDADSFAALHARARSVGATVNDVALAAFYRALFAELQPAEGRPMALNVSFDLRRYLDPADPMPAAANLSSVETAMLPRVSGESFTGTLARVVAEMATLKGGQPGVGSAVQLEYASRLGFKRVERMATEPMRRGREHGVSFPFLSNFGVLDAQALTFAGLTPSRALLLPPVGHPPFMMLAPSSYAGELSLAIGYADGETDPALVERILGGMVAELLSWCA
jgi:NRPS condensation-like uncharacterized protein